jgi:hypothetical protein
LPAAFIDKDLSLSFVTPENKIQYNGLKYAYVDNINGNHILKYSMGMSVLYAPFFFAAHFLAKPFGYSPDGFSAIYQMFIEFSGLFYILIGLWYLRKLLLQFYSEKIAALTLLFVFFGTNLLCYSTIEPAMSHAYTFSLFSVFLYHVFEFYKKVTLKSTIILGISFGLIVLVRPLNVFFVLPLLLFKIFNFKDLKIRLTFFVSHFKYILTFLLITGLVILPQLLYYKYVTGSYLVFSYGKERFFFNHPHLIEILLSFRKGWLIYTPIMTLALYGIWNMRKQPVNGFKLSILILLPIYLYLVSSWWCWWYGGSFGQRSLIDIYPLLTLPLAAFIYQMQGFNKTKKQIVYVILFFCLLLNVFQTTQYKYNIIDFDGMTFKEYVHVFGTLDARKIDTTLLKKPDYEKAVIGLKK